MGQQKNPASVFIGCFIIFIISIVFLSIVGTMLQGLFYLEVVPHIFKDIVILIMIVFGFVALLTVVSILFGKKSNLKTQEDSNDSKENNFEESWELLSDGRKMEVEEAFRILRLTPNVSYTKVSEQYYELTKKINTSRMNEELRKKLLEELNRAYEVLTEYYSKNA